MAVGLTSPDTIQAVPGIRLAAAHCGIKADPEKLDLVLIEIAQGSSCAAVFTRNRFCAAPVTVAREHISQQTPRFLIINSGNANAGTGEQGMTNARQTCVDVAKACDVDDIQVLPFSTGVIGAELEVTKIEAALPSLYAGLSQDNWLSAAEGIMTTDTLPKLCSRTVEVNGESITITGISKGSGMIKPDMATMLSYVTTDAVIEKNRLQQLLQDAVDQSFNNITIDGDTSTNDACVLVATGQSGVDVGNGSPEFEKTLNEVFVALAQAIVRDGEGATKFIEIEINGASSQSDAKELGYTIAHSPLVKTAFFASDPNWGRILAAIGRAPVEALDVVTIDLYLDDVCLLKNGLPDTNYSEGKGQAVMNQTEIKIRVELNQGVFSNTVWTTDLSYDYVKINAEYRS